MRKDRKKSRAGEKENAYRYRDKNLSRIGFASYAEYLASDLWRGIRLRVLKRQPVCPRCDGEARQVHHTDYGRAILSGRTLIGLIALCEDCHRWVEFCQTTGRKLSLEEVNEKLNDEIGDLHAIGKIRQVKFRKGSKAWKKNRKRKRRRDKIEVMPVNAGYSRKLKAEIKAAKSGLAEHRQQGLPPHLAAARGKIF